MTPEQVAVTAAELIAGKKQGPSPLACKYAPYLLDRMEKGQAVDAEKLAKIKTDCSAFIEAAHAEAIARLRDELLNDPFARGYAGKSPEAIQDLLTTEEVIYATQNLPLREEELVNIAAAKIRGEVYVAVRETTQVIVARRPPRIGVIWSGIPYTRNLPSVDNIVEAQS
jgi:hypothetical protein